MTFINTQSPPPSDALPPSKFQLPKVTQPPQIAPHTVKQVFKYLSLEGTSSFKSPHYCLMATLPVRTARYLRPPTSTFPISTGEFCFSHHDVTITKSLTSNNLNRKDFCSGSPFQRFWYLIPQLRCLGASVERPHHGRGELAVHLMMTET